jgi:putative spermidine/putrescine transport system substrate-binding protein
MYDKKKSRSTRTFSRRDGLKLGLAAAAVISAPAYIRPAWAQGKKLIIANSGGQMGESKRTALYEPFTKKTGIEIVTVAGNDFAKIKLQVENDAVEWDIVDVGHANLPRANELGLFEKLDESIVDWKNVIKSAQNPYAVGGTMYAGGIGHTTARLKAPKTWPEFFDAENFPGRRGLRTRVNDTLELAAMGSGVHPSEVFPIDVERAFKALDKIKPDVSHFISATSQTVSLIAQDETDFTFTYTNRVKGQQDAGVPMDFSFNQLICGVAWTGMLRGSKNKDASMQFLDFMLEADQQAALSNLSYSGATNVDALPMINSEVAKWLPDAGSKDNCFTDAEWWGKNLEELTIRYKEWMLA